MSSYHTIFILFAWLASTCQSTILAQKPIFNYRNFTSADGLDTKIIYKFTQDKEGFMWLATDRGVYRFDGYKFKKYKSPLDNNEAQISALANQMNYDSTANRLWIGSYSDIQYFDLNDYTFHRPAITEVKNKYNEKHCLLNIDTTKIWYGGNGFLYELSLKEKEKNLLPLLKNLPKDISHKYTHLTNFTEDILLVTAFNYCMLVDKKTYTVIKSIKALSGEIFLNTSVDPHHESLWISANQCLVQYDMSLDKRSTYYFSYFTEKGLKLNNIINSITHLDDNKLLLSNNILFDKKDHTHIVITNFNTEESNKINLEISQYKDKQGNVWRGSLNKGCNVLLAQNKNLSLFGPLLNSDGVNMEPYTSKITNDSKMLYVAGSNVSGIISIDLTTHQVVNLRNPANDNDGKGNVVNDVVIIGNEIYNCDKNNINKIVKNKFVPLKPMNNGSMKSFAGIQKMMPWQKALIAISADNHYYIDVHTGAYRATPLSRIDSTISKSFNVYFEPMFVTNDGTLWYGSNVGLYYQKPNQKIPLKIPLTYKNKPISLSIISADIDKDRRIWLGTVSNGVWIYNSIDKSLMKLQDENEQWQLDGVNLLTIDNKNIVHISSQNGIYKFNAANQNIVGVLNNQNGFIIDYAGYELKHQGNGLITMNTYPNVILYKSEDKAKIDKKQILLTSLKIANLELLKKPTYQWPKLTLNYPDKSFELEFTNLNYTNTFNHIFKYKLEGLDSEWTICQTNKIAFHRLPLGQYRLIIDYLDDTKHGDTNPLTIVIDVRPPLWKTWWFVLLTILAILYLFYFLYTQKMYALKKEMALKSQFEKQIVTLEMKALRAQMNPHFIFNSLNSIQKFIFEKDEYAASQYLTKFSRLIRLILDQSNQELTSISTELDLIKLYIEMEALRFDQQFDFTLTIDPAVELDYKIPSMVIQPHIENAIWHGLLHKEQKGNITLTIAKHSDTLLIISIEDNGIGRAMASELKSKQVLKKKSYGSNISEERIRLFNSARGLQFNIEIIDKIDSKGNANGTRVNIPIAYYPTHETNENQKIL